MDFNTTLKNYYKTKSDIRSCILKQQELRELGGFPKTGNMDGMPKSNSHTSYIEHFIERLETLEEKQIELEQILFGIQMDLERFLAVIETTPSLENNFTIKQVCEYRIFLGYGWKTISHKIDKSYSYTRSLYDLGIRIMRGVVL